MSFEEAVAKIVDDVLVERDQHGLSPRLARELQLAAQAITHERFRALMREVAKRAGAELGRIP